MRDLRTAKDGLGILHVSTGLEIDAGVMAELREVLESSGWEARVAALLWQAHSAPLTVWLCHCLGKGWAPKPGLWSQTLHHARTKNTTELEGEEHEKPIRGEMQRFSSNTKWLFLL